MYATAIDPYDTAATYPLAEQLAGIGLSSEPAQQVSVASACVGALEQLGVKRAFGIGGGGVACLHHALTESSIDVHEARHESGAAYMALESSLADQRPAVVYVTTGPGVTNAATGLAAAKHDGGTVILVGGSTAAASRGHGAFQETVPQPARASTGVLGCDAADDVFWIDHPSELAPAMRRIAAGVARPQGYVAAILIAADVQQAAMPPVEQHLIEAPRLHAAARDEQISHAVQCLRDASFVVWASFGARGAAHELRMFAERTGVAVMCSPRAKGTLPEDHPQYLGVTGLGGHANVERALARQRPDWILVLGTRLGENTSNRWSSALLPTKGFVRVDVDHRIASRPHAGLPSIPIVGDVAAVLRDLAPRLPRRVPASVQPLRLAAMAPSSTGVRPEALMDAVQAIVVDEAGADVLSEAGNSYAWATNRLRSRRARQYRVSSGFAAMGHVCGGVVGAAIATLRRSVAIVGDGSILMQNELTSALAAGAPATWIVLNDAENGMVSSSYAAVGLSGVNVSIPRVDFRGWARAQGVHAVRVEHEHELAAALRWAAGTHGPTLVDVMMQPDRAAPVRVSAQG